MRHNHLLRATLYALAAAKVAPQPGDFARKLANPETPTSVSRAPRQGVPTKPAMRLGN